MTRRKVKLAYITKNSARKATFNKRKTGLLTKADELSKLCGVDACAIIYSPYTAEPLLYPDSSTEVHRVLRRFGAMTEAERTSRMVNQREFLRQRVHKAGEQLMKLRRENDEKEATRVMLDGLGSSDPAGVIERLGVAELKDLRFVIESSLREVSRMLGQ